MSPVGHTLVGATIGVALWPQFEGRRQRTALLLGMVVAANIPDLPLPYWGHDRYYVSHSVFCGLLVATVIYLGMRASPLGSQPVAHRVIFFATALALSSHYLLDTFYNHGKGLAMFWPFSKARVALPIPWFSHMDITTHGQLFSWKNVRIWLVELAAFGTTSFVALAVVLPWQKRKLCEQPKRNRDASHRG